ncbi:hypothetical protein [Caulobacter sp. S45]|uniref:hypothetical protein n=1 Tax=Caulobacter sp. S45 TaxID=1641861 RepID=UPI001575F1CF|nr:hypothetical protein [Caulobacter sp. S45]
MISSAARSARFQDADAPQSDADWMRERVVIHKMVVAVHACHPALPDLLDELARSQGRLHSLVVRPVGEAFEAVLQATRLSPDAARRLVDRFAAHPEVACASIEHMLVR